MTVPQILRKRTIEHPGFEFFETDASIYHEFEVSTDALIVGFFARGPIGEPVALKNLQDYTVYFGQPESEAEIYAFEGIKNVINGGGTVTAIRLPYFNDTCSYTDTGLEPKYSVYYGDWSADGDTAETKALAASYETAQKFNKITLTRDSITKDQLVNIIGGTSDKKFAIVNKFNNFVTQKGEELIVSVLGVPNGIKIQGLNNVEEDGTSIKFPKAYNEADIIVTEVDSKNFGKLSTKWQNNGEITLSNELLTVANDFNKNLESCVPTIATYAKTKNETVFVDVKVTKNEDGKWKDAEGNEYADETVTPDAQEGDEEVTTGTAKKDSGKVEKVEKVYVDPRKDDFITVVVSKIKPSSLEIGKFTIETAEVFTGSILNDSIDPISQESNYIGDIINNSSTYISYYGKPITDWTDDQTLYSSGLTTERFSWSTEAGQDLNKTIYKKANFESNTDWVFGSYVDNVLTPLLKKVQNSTKYTYRDVYDCGLSSVLSYATDAGDGDFMYNPSVSIATETADNGFIEAPNWKKVVLAFARHCQYKHKLSMFHADGPRKLVLNGNLSRVDDLLQDPLNVVFAPKKIAALAIKDNTYIETNVQWWEVRDDFKSRKMWVPSSTRLAYILTSEDINGNVWTAPAGHNNAPITDSSRPAFIPDDDLADRIYLNCFNYGTLWPDGAMTIEGQKTGYAEISALNRINVRRLMIYLERYVKTVANAYLYEPNTADTRASFKAECDSEFGRVTALGGLYAYRIVVDESNNSPEVIDRNELRATFMVQPTKTIEFILGNFIITKTGVNLEEISPAF